MIYLRPGSHVHNLISVLSVVGEFPTSALHLLGNERVVKAMVHNLTSPQVIHNAVTGEDITCRLFGISGKGAGKTIRFYRAGLPILDWIAPGARDYYLDSFYHHRFPGNASHKDRHHRAAEAVAMLSRLGVEFRPYQLPPLQKEYILSTIPSEASFYGARELKRAGGDDLRKLSFSRILGVLFSAGNRYAVYNARNAAMKWAGQSEFKVRSIVSDLCRVNTGGKPLESAILMGKSYDVAMKMLGERDKNRQDSFRFDAVYHQVYFVPQTEPGLRQLRILLQPEWRESILGLLFENSARSYDRGSFEFDAKEGDYYVLSHLDGDIARLLRFRAACIDTEAKMGVLCFPHQTEFLREFLPETVRIQTVELEDMESALGLKRLRGVP